MEREGKEQNFFQILVEGKFAPEDIIYQERQNTMKRSLESESFLEETWQKLLQSGFKPWPNDTKISRYRFVDAKVEQGKLIVALDPCVSYRDSIGGCKPEFVKKFGKDFAPNPMGVTVSIAVKDAKGQEYFLITLRKETADYKGGGMHVTTGGTVNTCDKETPTEAAFRETEEESGITKKEIENMSCLGVVHIPWSPQTDVMFSATTNILLEDIKQRYHDDENEIIFIPNEKSKIQQWLLAFSHANTPTGLFGLLFACKEKYGEEWFREMRLALAWRSQDYQDKKTRDDLEQRDKRRLATTLGAKSNK